MGYRLSLLEKKCFQFKLNVRGGPTLDVNNFSEADGDKCSQKRNDSILGLDAEN